VQVSSFSWQCSVMHLICNIRSQSSVWPSVNNQTSIHKLNSIMTRFIFPCAGLEILNQNFKRLGFMFYTSWRYKFKHMISEALDSRSQECIKLSDEEITIWNIALPISRMNFTYSDSSFETNSSDVINIPIWIVTYAYKIISVSKLITMI